ncbi:hypothetical protein EJ377_01830 [Chryseobacterium arthrosphaerae]|uniref:Uncharacterized protein n=1 Tax=Chryseobacterium arthrosphaerae TaxID=651561 RepID=A0A432DYX4_9FLAO|nr:hypothetical protein EJ377_01830 [Chryseobacterium arthrosphaerae]
MLYKTIKLGDQKSEQNYGAKKIVDVYFYCVFRYWNDITNISWTDVGKFIESIFSLKHGMKLFRLYKWYWDDLTSWKGFSQDPVGMILQKAAGIANKVLVIAGVITGILVY